MIVLHFRIYVSFTILHTSKIPRSCIAFFLKSQIDPQIEKSQTVEGLNVNKSVNHSEEAVRAGFLQRNRAVFHSIPETGASKNMTPDSMTHAPEYGVEFMALISGAGFWVYVGSLRSLADM